MKKQIHELEVKSMIGEQMISMKHEQNKQFAVQLSCP
jgi:hypothetical protein